MKKFAILVPMVLLSATMAFGHRLATRHDGTRVRTECHIVSAIVFWPGEPGRLAAYVLLNGRDLTYYYGSPNYIVGSQIAAAGDVVEADPASGPWPIELAPQQPTLRTWLLRRRCGPSPSKVYTLHIDPLAPERIE